MLFLCLKIFFVRILDVSLGTLRTVITVKGKSFVASLVGFVEVSIWFLVVKEAINTSSNSLWIMFSYAGGFAVGTYIGSQLSNWLIKGTLSLQVVTSSKNEELLNKIRNNGYAVSAINIEGKDKDTERYMLFIEINKKSLSHLQKLIQEVDKKAFIVVNETKYVQNGFIK